MTDDDRRDENDRPDGVLWALLELLAEMDERDERKRRGRWSGDRTSVDFSVSVGGLDEALGSAGPDEPSTPDEAGAPAVTTREFDDELLIVADLPGVRAEDVSVDLDRDDRTVRVTVGRDVVGRVPLDDGDWTVADVSVNNGVLEARLTRE